MMTHNSRKMRRFLSKRTTNKKLEGKRTGIFGLDDIICAAVGLVAGLATFLVASSFSTVDRYIDLQSSESQYYKILNMQEEGTMFMETALGFVLEWAVNNTATYGGINNDTAHKEWLDEFPDTKKGEAEIPVPAGVDVPICQTCDPALEMFEYMKIMQQGGGDESSGDTGDCMKAAPGADGLILIPESQYYDIVQDGETQATTPELCVIIHRAAKDFYEKFNTKITINDITQANTCGQSQGGHNTHQCGEDVDIIGTMCNCGAAHEQSVFLAQSLIKHNEEYKDKLKGPIRIIFDDGGVLSEVNAWAQQQGYAGMVVTIGGHCDHFHVHVDRDGNHAGNWYGSTPGNSPDCCKPSAT